jgi:hypothetical protein
MKIAHAVILLTMLALSNPGQAATVRELDAAELRQAARAGDIISLKRVIEAVTTSTGGEPLEARAFEIDELYYRIVMKRPNGTIVSVIINARTGEQVSKGSSVGRQVASAAETGSKSKGKSQTAGANGKGTGNTGGNGSSGGSGGDNGGNGGGNGGGGNGNGGGKN